MFDPVRDAILNSPERVSYADEDNGDEEEDPFERVHVEDGQEQQEQGSNGVQDDDQDDDDDDDEEDSFEAVEVPFKAPTTAATAGRESSGVSSVDTSAVASSSPPRRPRTLSLSSRQSPYDSSLLDVAQTPGGVGTSNGGGGGTGGSAGGADYTTPLSSRPSLNSAHRQSSIFSLLSPEPPTPDHSFGDGDVQGESHGTALADPLPVSEGDIEMNIPSKPSSARSVLPSNVNGNIHAAPTPLSAHEQLKRRVLKPSSSRPVSSSSSSTSSAFLPPTQPFPSAQPSTSTSTIPTIPAVWRKPYAPLTRLNGPPTKAFYIPLTQREWEFYTNPANCKNPLRSAAYGPSRTGRPYQGGHGGMANQAQAPNGKGKSREEVVQQSSMEEREDAVVSAEEQHLAPRYAPASPLHPSLIPEQITRQGITPGPETSLNGSSQIGESGNRKRKRANGRSSPEVQLSREGDVVAAHCEWYNPVISPLRRTY